MLTDLDKALKSGLQELIGDFTRSTDRKRVAVKMRNLVIAYLQLEHLEKLQLRYTKAKKSFTSAIGDVYD